MKSAVEAAIIQCWELVTLAEPRIGAELKAAQERGEVARSDGSTHHRPKVSEDRTPSAATLAEIGIPRQRAAEMKKMAGQEPAIRAEAKAALAEGRRNEELAERFAHRYSPVATA